jgi:hypothetical protein
MIARNGELFARSGFGDETLLLARRPQLYSIVSRA